MCCPQLYLQCWSGRKWEVRGRRRPGKCGFLKPTLFLRRMFQIIIPACTRLVNEPHLGSCTEGWVTNPSGQYPGRTRVSWGLQRSSVEMLFQRVWLSPEGTSRSTLCSLRQGTPEPIPQARPLAPQQPAPDTSGWHPAVPCVARLLPCPSCRHLLIPSLIYFDILLLCDLLVWYHVLLKTHYPPLPWKQEVN